MIVALLAWALASLEEEALQVWVALLLEGVEEGVAPDRVGPEFQEEGEVVVVRVD